MILAMLFATHTYQIGTQPMRRAFPIETVDIEIPISGEAICIRTEHDNSLLSEQTIPYYQMFPYLYRLHIGVGF